MGSETRAGINQSMSGAEWAMLLTLSLLWGGSFFFTGIAVRELPPLTIVLARVGLAALILLLALRLLGQHPPGGGQAWAACLGMGVLNNVLPFCLIVWGQTQIASGLAAVLNATTPLATVVVAHFLTADEKLTTNRLAGVLLGLIGVVAMIGPAAMAGIGSAVGAQLAVLAAAVSYAFAGVFGRRFSRMGIGPLPAAAGQVTASTLMLLPVTLLLDRPWTLASPSLATWAALLGIAALSTAAAYVLYFRVLTSAGATNLLLVTFLIPVSAILLGVGVLGERLSPEQLIGMALIGLGLAAIDGRPAASLRRAVTRSARA